jgi:Right handed beta helix region
MVFGKFIIMHVKGVTEISALAMVQLAGLLVFISYLFPACKMHENSSEMNRVVFVSNLQELKDALLQAKPYAVIWIASGARIELPVRGLIEITKPVTLKGQPADSGKSLPIIYSNNIGCDPAIIVRADHVTFESINFCGPDSSIREQQMAQLSRENKYYSLPYSYALHIEGSNSTVRKCNFSGWSYSAIALREGTGHLVERCSISYCRRSGLGYGVSLLNAEASIKHNYFDFNRHDIAGSGSPKCGYVVEKNYFGANGNGHSVDMHTNPDTALVVAGKYIIIRENTFHTPKEKNAIFIGTSPLGKCVVQGNNFINLTKNNDPIDFRGQKRLFSTKENKFLKLAE